MAGSGAAGARRVNDVPIDHGVPAMSRRAKQGVPLDVAVFSIRILEFLAVLITGAIAVAIIRDTLMADTAVLYTRVVIVAAIAYGVLGESLGCYDVDAQFSLRRAWQRVATTWVTVALFMITLGFLLKSSEVISRAWALGWFAAGGATLLVLRAGSTLWVRRLKRRGTFDQRVAIFGAGPQGLRFAEYVQQHDRLTISLIGLFDDRRDGRVPAMGRMSMRPWMERTWTSGELPTREKPSSSMMNM